MTISEKEWLDGARELNQEALASIYDAFSPVLFRYAFRLLGNEEVAEDVVAETFYRFLRTISAGGGPQNHLKAYLYRVAHNLIVDCYRRNPPLELSLDPDVITHHSMSGNPEKMVVGWSEQVEVRRILWKLTSDQRQVIILKYFEGMTNQEVSDVLGKPIGAVKSLQHRGLNALRRLFTPDEI